MCRMGGVRYPTPMDAGLIRTDQIGRLRFTAEQRRGLLDAFEGSGQSASGFAAQHRIKYATFANWVQMRRSDRSSVSPSPALNPVKPLLLAEVSCGEARWRTSPDASATPWRCEVDGGVEAGVNKVVACGTSCRRLFVSVR
jgi:hypothetical protein